MQLDRFKYCCFCRGLFEANSMYQWMPNKYICLPCKEDLTIRRGAQ